MKPLRKGGLVDGGVVVDLVAAVGVAVVAAVELLMVQRRRRLLLPSVVKPLRSGELNERSEGW